MKIKTGYWPWFAARIFVGMIFAYAGYTKLTEPIENFRAAILQYEVIPYATVTLIVTVLPWIEFLGGIFLILGYLPRWSALTLGMASLGFLIVLGSSNVLLEAPSDCGCFGENSLIHLTVHQIFFVDLLNFGLCLKLFSLKSHPYSLDAKLHS